MAFVYIEYALTKAQSEQRKTLWPLCLSGITQFCLMNKKRWTLLILCILLIAGWVKLFYKTWNNEGVTKNADCIITLDVKKITNTLIWNFITTPSQWKNGSWFSSSEEGKVSWDDMISLPDYVFIFHRSGEPDDAFYTVVKINNKDDFEKGLKQYGFEKTPSGSFISKATGIEFIQDGNKLLLGNAAIEDKKYIQGAAAEIFNQKNFIDEPALKRSVEAKSHLALNGVLFNKSILAGFYEIKGNFDDEAFHFSMPVSAEKGTGFTTHTFAYCDTSMLSFGFTQPTQGFEKLIPLQNFSKAVNFSIDSFLLPTNKHYQLDITGIYPRTDSAITYSYDDNFNAIENVVVNKVDEPAFNFTVSGDNVNNIYDYWKRNGKLENNGDGSLFTPVPFAKSYCSVKNKNTLSVTSAGYKETVRNKNIEHGLFLRILLTKVPPSFLNYLPPAAVKLLKNIETVEAFDSNEKGQTILNVKFNKKKNDLPLAEF